YNAHYRIQVSPRIAAEKANGVCYTQRAAHPPAQRSCVVTRPRCAGMAPQPRLFGGVRGGLNRGAFSRTMTVST
ncbi:MAG: hypothetical protein ACK45X_09420, partial [Roseiflexaceae bacterium]